MNPWTASFEEHRQNILGEAKKKSDKKSSERWQDDDADGKWYEKSDVDGKISDREKKEKKKNVKENTDCCKKCGSYEHTTKECTIKEGIEDIIARLEKKRIRQGGNPDESPLGKKTGRAMKDQQDKARKKKVKKESVEVSHIDGSTTEIIDLIRAPKMPSAAPISEIDGSKLGIGLATGIAAGGLHLIKKTKDAAEVLRDRMKKRTQIGEHYSDWREDFIWEGPATAKDPKLDVKETGVKNKIEINPEVKTEEKKKLTKTSPLTDRVLNWSKTKKTEEVIAEGPSDKSDARTKRDWKGPGAPGLDAHKERIRKHKERRGKKKVKEEALDENPLKNIKDTIVNSIKGIGVIKKAIDNPGTGLNPNTRKALKLNKELNDEFTFNEGKKKKKDDTYLEPNWEKRKKNNEKARKDLQKGPQMRNPHLEQANPNEVDLDWKIKNTQTSWKTDHKTGNFSVGKSWISDKDRVDKMNKMMGGNIKMDADGLMPDAGAFVQKNVAKSIPIAAKYIDKGNAIANKALSDKLGKEVNIKNMDGKTFSNMMNQQNQNTAFNINKHIPGTQAHRVQGVADMINNNKSLKASYEPESELVELNRYGKETGKATGSINKRPGSKIKKGGDEPSALRNVRGMIRRETGKPEGQRKKSKGEKGRQQPGDRRGKPADTIARRRQSRKDAEAAMMDTRGT